MAIKVKADPSDNPAQVIRKFKKKIQREKILTKIRDNQFYKPPSVIKKERKKEKERKIRRGRRDR